MRNYEITDEILKIALQFIENSTFEELLSLLPKENLKLETGGISMSEHLQYPEMMADIELCHEQLSEICQDKHNKAVMSVPPRQTDFDIQLSAALDELKAYRKMGTVEQCKQLINAWNTRAAKAKPRILTLEELREMDGLPVWIIGGYGFQCWALVNIKEHNCTRSDRNIYSFDNYGSNSEFEWLAYNHQPKGDKCGKI